MFGRARVSALFRENAKMAHSSRIANQVSISAQLSISHGGTFTAEADWLTLDTAA